MRSGFQLAKFFAAGLMAWMLAHPAAVSAVEPPNVLLILSDDLRPQLGCYGDPTVHSPAIDDLAQRSLRFDRAYVQCAICSPTRNSLLSGLRPSTTGLRGFGVTLRDVRPDVVTLPQHFRRQGYHAAAFGKVFHVYAETILGSEDDPQSWSQPLYLPQLPVWGPEQNALRTRLIAEAIARGTEFRHPHDWPRGEVWDAPDVSDDELQDGEIANRAIAWLRSRPEDAPPFFLAVGFLKPHLPYVAPKRYFDLYDPERLPLPDNQFPPRDAPPWSINQGVGKSWTNFPPPEEVNERFLRRYLQAYLACISYMDACTDKLLTAVDDLGLREETIVVFLGDHGYQMGEHNSWGHKHSNYETSTRAPLLIASPGQPTAGQGTTSLVEFLDLYPTLCELAGLTIPEHVEGVSLTPLMQDPQARVHSAAFSEMQRGQRLGRSIRTDRHRYVEWTGPMGAVVAQELYDEVLDPGENQNIFAPHAETALVEELRGALQQTLPRQAVPTRDAPR